jgi:alpha-galactosidase
MIHFDTPSRTFSLITARSIYAFRIDDVGQVVHVAHQPLPSGAHAPLASAVLFPPASTHSSFEQHTDRAELVTFGDVTYHEVALKVSAVAQDPVLGTPLRDVRLRYARHAMVTDDAPGCAPVHGLPPHVRTPRETLRVVLADALLGLDVTLHYRLTPEHDIIERWVTLHNTSTTSLRVEQLAWATVHVPAGTRQLTHLSGAWARETMPQRDLLPDGVTLIEGRSFQTGHAANPVYMLNAPRQAWEETGTVWFGALAWSGAWRIAFDVFPQGDIRAHAGHNPFDFELMLAAGASHVTPQLVCGVSHEGWGGASRRLHRFGRERVLPAPNAPRPVLYNSWDATYFNLDTESQIALARKAAAIGVELYCLDDGWFGARRHDRAGLGDWEVSPDVFPDGLGPLVRAVRELGMKFGLWVEPEMVNPDSDLYRAHPDWVVHWPGRPRREARNQLILDFGRPEVVAHIFNKLDAILTATPIDFIKWDMNRNTSDPGSVAGREMWRVHAEAVYQIIDRLRERHPHTDVQSCSGGGGRIDLGILGRADQVWTSDNTDALDRIRIQEGYSLAYPARAMESWVTHAHNHQTGRNLPLETRFEVAMRGALGIGSSLNELSVRELERYAEYIACYKRIRHIVQDGDLYRLQRLEEFGASVIQYVLPDASEAVLSIAVRDHQHGLFRPPPPLRALDAAAMYALHDVHGSEVMRARGQALMLLGVPGASHTAAASVRTLHLVRV